MTDNERVLAEYNNPDNIKIMESASRRFRFLDSDEIESCKLIAIWKAIKNNNSKTKFTTSLYNNVVWQCKDRAKLLLKDNSIAFNDIEKISKKDNFNDIIELILSVEDGDLLIQKYLYNLTLKEISKKNNLNIETARLKIESAKNRLTKQNPE